jgi:hypothetical protein
MVARGPSTAFTGDLVDLQQCVKVRRQRVTYSGVVWALIADWRVAVIDFPRGDAPSVDTSQCDQATAQVGSRRDNLIGEHALAELGTATGTRTHRFLLLRLRLENWRLR